MLNMYNKSRTSIEAAREERLEAAMFDPLANTNSCVPIRGAVYGVALYAGEAVENGAAAPEKAVPSSPVLFIKPPNTFLANGGMVWLPATMSGVTVSASLAIVFARDTRLVTAAEAFDGVEGYTLALDLTEEGAGFFRPPVREKCRDGFLPIGPRIVSRKAIDSLDELEVRLEIDGEEVASFAAGEKRNVMAKLIEEVSAFMTLRAGDVLLAASTPLSARAQAGSRIAAASRALGRLECRLAAEEEVPQ